ncbi:MAG: hypothetical protein HHAS10_09590 [Candidatus Altimarinota bacterium]
MLSNSQKEHLTYTAVGQVAAIIGMAIVVYQYILPGLNEISQLSKDAEAAFISYSGTYNAGVSESSLQKVLSSSTEYAELIKIIQTDPEYTRKILVKENMSITGSSIYKYDCSLVDYFTCVKSVLGRVDKEKESIKNEKAKLNSIIPTMSPLSNNIEEDNITLREYVNFIEKSILQKFHFDSNVVIGMQGLTFGQKTDGIPESIGMYEFRLDFEATNKDIQDFIEYINQTGKPDILSFTGELSKDRIPKVMSNPLITMEALSMQEKLDLDNPTKLNTGRATLRFYIRGVSKDDIQFLSENLRVRRTDLEARIQENVRACENDGVMCAVYNPKLKAFQRKFDEYSRGLNETLPVGTSPEMIYALNQTATTLKSLEQELDSIIPKKDK